MSVMLIASNASAKGVYGSHAVDLWGKIGGGGRTTVASPDGRSRVIVQYGDDRGMTIRTAGAIGKLSFATDAYVASELTWSPDSKAFFITGSDGGAVGDFHLLIVDRFADGLAMRDASKAIYSAFGHPVKCDAPEAPNVGGIKWLPGHRVLVAAEILPHSVCDSTGTFKAYELDPGTMKVGRRYGQLEAKKLFGPDLGQELTAADDECVKKPTSCYVSTNHPEQQKR
ncbi:MAG: hypothetical protein ACXU82_16150 [Caulobacteraceae bacterium]